MDRETTDLCLRLLLDWQVHVDSCEPMARAGSFAALGAVLRSIVAASPSFADAMAPHANESDASMPTRAEHIALFRDGMVELGAALHAVTESPLAVTLTERWRNVGDSDADVGVVACASHVWLHHLAPWVNEADNVGSAVVTIQDYLTGEAYFQGDMVAAARGALQMANEESGDRRNILLHLQKLFTIARRIYLWNGILFDERALRERDGRVGRAFNSVIASVGEGDAAEGAGARFDAAQTTASLRTVLSDDEMRADIKSLTHKIAQRLNPRLQGVDTGAFVERVLDQGSKFLNPEALARAARSMGSPADLAAMMRGGRGGSPDLMAAAMSAISGDSALNRAQRRALDRRRKHK